MPLFGKEKPTKRELLKEQSPEREIVAAAAVSGSRQQLADAFEERESLREKLTSEEFERTGQDLSRAHARVLHDALESHGRKEGGYRFSTLYDLESVHALMTMNPAMPTADQEHYARVWQELEKHAPALFRAEAEHLYGNMPVKRIQELSARLAAFPFIDSATKEAAARSLEEGCLGLAYDDLNSARFHDDPIGFLSKELVLLQGVFETESAREKIKGAVDAEAGARFQHLMEYAHHYRPPIQRFSQLRPMIDAFPFSDDAARGKVLARFDEEVLHAFSSLLGSAKHYRVSSKIPLDRVREICKEADAFPFAGEDARAKFYAESDKVAVPLFEEEIASSRHYPQPGPFLERMRKEAWSFPFGDTSLRAGMFALIEKAAG